MNGGTRLLIVQYTGDYRVAYDHLSKGGGETYYAQQFSIDFVAELGREIEQAGVLCCKSQEHYDEVLPNGVRAMGAAWTEGLSIASVIRLFEEFRPTHLVLGSPRPPLLKWGLRHRLPVLPLFADTFYVSTEGLSPPRKLARLARHWLRGKQLASILNRPGIRWIGNHNINACRALAELGVRPEKIVPWDWPPIRRPDMFAPKGLSAQGRAWRLVFVGGVVESKGVGDAIDAVAELRRRGRHVELTVIGKGDASGFIRQAESLGVADCVRLEGQQPQTRVVDAMRSADLVLVPSRHEYSEGLPMVIYEALAVRTPLICSDHPAFRGRIGEGKATLTFPERRPEAFADAIERVLNDPTLYGEMSIATASVWEKMQCPVKYGDLIRRWVLDGAETDRWLSENSLATLESR